MLLSIGHLYHCREAGRKIEPMTHGGAREGAGGPAKWGQQMRACNLYLPVAVVRELERIAKKAGTTRSVPASKLQAKALKVPAPDGTERHDEGQPRLPENRRQLC